LTSVTVTARGIAKAVPSSVFWEEPVPTVSVEGAEAMFVSVNVTGAVTPLTVAVTVNVPTVEPAMSSGLVAVPFVPVWTAAAAPPPTKVAPAPLVVATVKLTVVPGTAAP
jgi:hypothetical protein